MTGLWFRSLITDPAKVLELIGKTAQLEFRFANTEKAISDKPMM